MTGDGTVHYHADGAFTLTLQGGHMLVGLPGPSAPGPGLFLLGGAGHAVTVLPDGSRLLDFSDGPVEDLCATVAGGAGSTP